MTIKLCSACLLGIKCRYDGEFVPNEKVLSLAEKEVLIPFCPEQFGGLPTPRLNSEIQKGDGFDVLDNKAKVFESGGADVTNSFITGAEEVLKIARLLNVSTVILKQRSPSCGSGQIYDGTFSGTIINGNGVTSALLKRNGIKVIAEDEL
jgi:uncharacterized protein YbbK (DUF523 family)